MNPIELCRLLHQNYVSLMENYDKFYYMWWYDNVYTLITRELIEKFPEIDTVRWSWCVSTGEEWA